MKRRIKLQLLFAGILFMLTSSLKAQYLLNSDSAFKAGAANSGRIWGYMFGDLFYKSHSDSLKRGNNNQYSGIPTSRNAFQFRRIYLGYDYNITSRFSAELLLAAEDNFPALNPPSNPAQNGDLLQNNKLTFYIKLANIRWKNIWKGTDLIVGQVATPAFPLIAEKVWSYRSIERTISDIRRTPSYDLGAELQGKFDAKGNYGYNIMVGNGTGDKPEGSSYKWFYGDVYAMFFDKKLIFDLYADYQRLNWQSYTPASGATAASNAWHHSRQMLKGYIAYNTPALTIGAEGYINNLKNDLFATKATGVDTLSEAAKGLSLYVHGNVITGKLRFFARYDMTDPNSKINNAIYTKYTGNLANYNESTTKEQFITAGLDFTPAKNVHFMPNIWYNNYKSKLDNTSGSLKSDYDLVYRMTFFFTFGK
ncbi:hypothetical protein ACX0G9_19480 [Flavitalea flava]